MLVLALAFLACDGGTNDADGDAIRIRLVNPTDADPMEEVDAFRLDLLVDGELLESSTFDLDEPWSLSGQTEYGQLRFEVAGLAGDEVVSYGRSAEFAILPGVDRDVPITFLPVNEVLPLSADVDLAQGRKGHELTLFNDGRALIHGGLGVTSNRPLNPMWVYDPSEGAVLETELNLGYAVADPVVAWDFQQRLVYAGGASDTTPNKTRLKNSAVLDPVAETIDTLPPLQRQRFDHCFRFVRDGYAVAMGGTASALPSIEVLRSDGAGEGNLVWSEEEIFGLDSSGVNACELTSDGRLFLQGNTVESTGVFDAVESEDGGSLEPVFTPIWANAISGNGWVDFSTDAAMIPLDVGAEEDALVWVGGGLDLESGSKAVVTQPRVYNLDAERFQMGFGSDLQPRVAGDWGRWLLPGSVVLSCGYTDGNYNVGQDRIELFEPENGASLGWWELPNRRAGCQSAVLSDGSVLVTGGLPESGETQPWVTAVLVPYIE
ncbi:MAG: hypothetical protein VX519_09190 [Myxococcota bacterium]|nr:hypothetical protein [Myxococcota bacterium]